MTRPPEYGQVAVWLRAIRGDPGLVEDIKSGYYDIKYAVDDGLTLERYVDEQRQFLAEGARRALGGIALDGTSVAQVAEAYHDAQIAEFAVQERALLDRIRALERGDFQVPAWCADDAAHDGISLTQAIERFRRDEAWIARKQLDLLAGQYAVRAEEVAAYWAAVQPGQADRAGSGSRTPGDGSSPQGRPQHDQALRRRPGPAADLAALDFPALAVTRGPDAPSAARRVFGAAWRRPASWIRRGGRVSP